MCGSSFSRHDRGVASARGGGGGPLPPLPELEAAHAALRALFDLIQREALPASRADRSAFELRAGPELERLQRAVLAAEAEEKAQAAEVERLVRDRIAGLRQRLLAIMQRPVGGVCV